ncbi:MAG: WG repeat-containing protein [Ruminococcaceae bacterium]|nr:WG repeat-containing protein [Oscillospiraceae bacterium]
MMGIIKKTFCLMLIVSMLLPIFSGCTEKSNGGDNILFSEGLISVFMDGKWGFMNKKGEVKIKAKYDSVTEFSCGLAGVGIDGKFGYIDIDGEIVIPLKFDGAASFADDIALVYEGEEYKFIDTKGNYLFDRSFEYADVFHEGMALFSENEKFGYINTKGEVVIEPQYKSASRFSEGLAGVMDEESGLCGFINKKGKLVIDYLYTEAGVFEDGCVRVGIEGNICYIDNEGELLLRTKLNADSFSEGYARYANDEKLFGFVNMAGKTVIDCKYAFAGPFSNGLALVYTTEGKVGYINTKGEYVIKPEYSLFRSDSSAGFNFSDNGYVLVVENERFGVLDKEGNVILECKYDGLDGNIIYNPLG